MPLILNCFNHLKNRMGNPESRAASPSVRAAHALVSKGKSPARPFCGPETLTFDPYVHDDVSVKASLRVVLDDPYSWDPDTTGESSYSRILVYRDYSHWPVMKFSEDVPPILVQEMHVDEKAWKRTFEEINTICAEMDQLNRTTVLDTFVYCFDCFYCRKTNADRCSERLASYICKENRTIYNRLGLEIRNPAFNGYRYIEVVVKYLRFRTSKPILHWGTDYPKEPGLEPRNSENWSND